MALEQIIAVAALAAGASVTVAHDISDGSGPLKPNYVMPDRPTTIGVTEVTTTSITFTNAGSTADTVNFSVRRNHSLVGGTTEMFWSSTSKLIDLEYWKNNRVIWGALIVAPTTPSTQGSGAVAPVVRINRTSGGFVLKGILSQSVSSADLADQSTVPAASMGTVPVLEVGQSVVAVRLGLLGTATATGAFFWGTPATTGSAVPPSDAVIRAAVLAWQAALNPGPVVANPAGDYVRLGSITVNRTGDTTITQTQDNSWRDF